MLYLRPRQATPASGRISNAERESEQNHGSALHSNQRLQPEQRRKRNQHHVVVATPSKMAEPTRLNPTLFSNSSIHTLLKIKIHQIHKSVRCARNQTASADPINF